MIGAAGALICAAASAQQSSETVANPQRTGAPEGTEERSSTLNNSANRAAEAAQKPTEREQFAKVPGGPATPKKDWSKGDPRGKPQNPADYTRGRRGKKHRKGTRRTKAQP